MNSVSARSSTDMSKQINKLTDEQKAAIPAYVKKWIDIGLRTGKTDWDTFDKYMPICYAKAGLKYPKRVVLVNSPLVGALAAAVADKILYNRQSDRDAVDGAVYDAVYDAVRKHVISPWHPWLGGQFWVGNYWYGTPAVVTFFTEICGLKLKKEIEERAEAYRKICESVNYIWPNKDFVIVCARPKAINRDEKGRLHCMTGKSIEYGDGWGLYHLWGVKFDEPEWTIYRSGDAKKILALKNSDQRATAIRAIGGEKIIKACKGKVIGEDEFGQVIELQGMKDGNGQPYRYLVADDPAHGGKVYLRTRPDISSPAEAEAWSYALPKDVKYKPLIRT